MIGLDAGAREFERVERFAAAGRDGRRDLSRGHADADAAEIELVEFERVVVERAVAAGGDIGDDGAHGGFDIGRRLALGAEQSPKFFGKIAGAAVETNRHNTEPNTVRTLRRRRFCLYFAALSSSPL